MTRLAVLADIHANLPALEAVRRDLARERIDRVIVAGDIINWGPSSAEVVDIITRERWTVIRGNNEMYLLDHDTPRSPDTWKSLDFASLRWLSEQLRGERHSMIAIWPDTLSLRFPDAPALRVVHGSPRSHWEAMHRDTPDRDLAAMLAGIDERFVIAGHTHLAMDRVVERWRVLNPGSVGLPLEGRSGAEYMLLEGDASGWRPEWRRIDYDATPLFAAFECSGLIERTGPVGELMIEEFQTNRIQVHAFVIWRNLHYPGQPFTPEMLAEFRQTDRWKYTEPGYHVNRGV